MAFSSGAGKSKALPEWSPNPCRPSTTARGGSPPSGSQARNGSLAPSAITSASLASAACTVGTPAGLTTGAHAGVAARAASSTADAATVRRGPDKKKPPTRVRVGGQVNREASRLGDEGVRSVAPEDPVQLVVGWLQFSPARAGWVW
ncbi:hypothetical protein GCM10009416_34790 [Craurococcus roseus]|uniref:Uncharacterized protein n=1 Tax=Craurococcus roseus TaxID=77585 RepID=A0ABN1FLX7_9PROT